MIDGVLCRPCSKCGTYFSDDEKSMCDTCTREYYKEWQAKNYKSIKKPKTDNSPGLFDGVSNETKVAMDKGVNAFMKLNCQNHTKNQS